MPRRPPRKTGFAHRPLALRRELLAVLGRVDTASAIELACYAYSGRINRSHPPACSTVQIATVRKALRRMIENGNVIAVGHHRRRRVFSLARQTEFPPLVLALETLDG